MGRRRDGGRAARGTSRLEVYDDLPHGWQMLDGFVPEARAALRQAALFIRQHLPGATSGGNISDDAARLLVST
ncbi:MAG TPA: hypothetical protein VGA87_00090 [Pyrinomonadaceae bacterium]